MKDEGGRMKKNQPSKSCGDNENIHPSSFIRHPSTPKRRFGQNFLVDRNVVDRIIAAFDPQPDQTIIEIGPGRGALTSLLVEKAKRVVAIEFDRELVAQLRAK